MNHIQIINNFKNKKILVIGDLMLDKYLFGTVSRISPEAPIQILKAKKEELRIGGAGNAANNISSLQATPILLSRIGKDINGSLLLKLLEKQRINTKHIIKNSLPTIVKKRVIAQKQQLLRIDYEVTQQLTKKEESKIISKIKKLIPKTDVILISDYNKGFITQKIAKTTINLAIKQNKLTIVDPRPRNKEFYKNAFIISPNKKEAYEMSKLDESVKIEKVGRKLVKELNANVLITRGEEGMSLFEKNGSITTMSTKAKEVADVSGAGDTAISVLALALATKYNLKQAIELANHAAGLVVAKLGTAIITKQELLKSFK